MRIRCYRCTLPLKEKPQEPRDRFQPNGWLAAAANETVTPEKLESWVRDGWVDLRLANCARWVERFQKIREEIAALPADDTSSRFLRNRRFWHKIDVIQPGKVVGWILGTEEGGARIKG